MRIDDSAGDLAAEVAGTSSGDHIEAVAWRGEATPVPLEVEAWALSWDESRQQQGQGSLTVSDPQRALSPWGMGDLLAPGGGRVTLTWASGSSDLRVPLGDWRIRRSDPREQWRIMNAGSTPVAVASGGSVTLAIDEDATATPALCRLDAETVRTTTRLAEVRRLLAAAGVGLDVAGVSDATIPASLIYEDARMDAIEDHLTNLGAVWRGGPDGSLQVLRRPTLSSSPVWTIAGGEGGALVDITRTLSDEQVYNAVVSSSEDAAGRQIVGRAYLRTGPLAWGGPYGVVPLFHQSPALTAAGVQADAQTLLANRVAGAEVVISVNCLFHPALQLHDVVEVIAPTTVGDQGLRGRVVSMSVRSISGAGSTPTKSMDVGVSVAVEALEAVAARIGRG